jgi:hypothetical protein
MTKGCRNYQNTVYREPDEPEQNVGAALAAKL